VGGWKTLHNEELNNFFTSPDIVGGGGIKSRVR